MVRYEKNREDLSGDNTVDQVRHSHSSRKTCGSTVSFCFWDSVGSVGRRPNQVLRKHILLVMLKTKEGGCGLVMKKHLCHFMAQSCRWLERLEVPLLLGHDGVQRAALCGAECSSPENWRLFEVEFKGFMVPRFRLLPAASHGKFMQGCQAVVGCALTMGHGPAQ